MKEEKVFGYKPQELVEIFSNSAEVDEKMNDATIEHGFGRIVMSPYTDMLYTKQLQDKINESRMSRADKQYVCDMIGALAKKMRYCGYLEGLKKCEKFDDFVAEKIEKAFEEHKIKVEEE